MGLWTYGLTDLRVLESIRVLIEQSLTTHMDRVMLAGFPRMARAAQDLFRAAAFSVQRGPRADGRAFGHQLGLEVNEAVMPQPVSRRAAAFHRLRRKLFVTDETHQRFVRLLFLASDIPGGRFERVRATGRRRRRRGICDFNDVIVRLRRSVNEAVAGFN